MSERTVYFSDNFFSSGETDIYSEDKKVIGLLDLRSAFSAGVDIKANSGEIIVSGGFAFFSNRWIIKDDKDAELGQLRERFAFFKTVYEYHAFDRGVYRIESPAFSREYTIYHDNDVLAAHFQRVDGFFQSPAYQLTDYCSELSTEELVAVVMGVNAIQKRRSANRSNVHHS